MVLSVPLTDPCSWGGDPRSALAAYSLLILRRGRLGRKGLAGVLEVGEATGRTIMSKLKSAGLAEADRRGARLTREGEIAAAELARIVEPAEVEMPERYGDRVACLIVRVGCDALGTGVAQRDEAVKGGADGALILVRRGGRYVFPDGSYEYPLRVSPEPGEGECVVVSWAGSGAAAVSGAMRAAGSMACPRRRGARSCRSSPPVSALASAEDRLRSPAPVTAETGMGLSK